MTYAEYVAGLSWETKGGGCLGARIRRLVRPRQSPWEEEACPGPRRAAPGVSPEQKEIKERCKGVKVCEVTLSFLHRQYIISGFLGVSLQVPAVPELPVQRNGSALCADSHTGAVCTPGQWAGGVCVRQMRVYARAGIQVRLGDSQGEGAFIREAAEADAGEGQDQTVGAPKLLPETPTGLPEPGQHQRGGWRAREGGL